MIDLRYHNFISKFNIENERRKALYLGLKRYNQNVWRREILQEIADFVLDEENLS